MRYYESARTELKREITDEIKKEIVAFLNTHGGTIYVGVNDDGSIYYNLSDKEKDIEMTKIINWLANNVFSPNPKEFISLSWNQDGVLEINVAEGNEKPYYITELGCNSKGVYLRFESSKMPATPKEIKSMRLESNLEHYEDLLANKEDLHFTYLENKLKEKNLDLSFETIGFIKNQKWTNLAHLFSDEFNVKSKLYLVDNKNNILKRKEWKGSILKQLDEIDLYIKDNIKGGYPEVALEEALKNTFIHRNWSVRGNIKIEISPTKINFISPGGLYHISELEANSGIRKSRNPKLQRLLKLLGYTNLYSQGLKEIYNSCHEYKVEPIVIATSSLFILSIPKKKR